MRKDRDPEIFYRYFDVKEHADRLLQGYVWISTLKHIRTCDTIRADASEAILTYKPTGFDSKNSDQATRITRSNLNALGFKTEDGFKATFLGNITFIRHHPNSFIFCSSESRPTKKLVRLFGSYCVKVNHAGEFWNAVTIALGAKFSLAGADFDRVKYINKRDARHGDGSDFDSVVFSCPVENKDEAEVRFFWPVTDPERIEPFELFVPDISDLCSTMVIDKQPKT